MAMSRKIRRALEKRKKRIIAIGLDFGKDVRIAGIQAHPDGSTTFLGEDGEPLAVPRGSAGIVHERGSGKLPKVIVQVPDSGERIGVVDQALSNFGRVFGVDTNTYTYRGERIHVVTACELEARKYEPPAWSASGKVHWAVAFSQPGHDPERTGWAIALRFGLGAGWFAGTPEALLLVDAHLGTLHDINARRVPLIGESMLPEGVALGYAGADRADHMANKLLAYCDQTCHEVHTFMKENTVDLIATPDDAYYAAYRPFAFPWSAV